MSYKTLHSLARTCRTAIKHALLPRKRERSGYKFGRYFSIVQFKQALPEIPLKRGIVKSRGYAIGGHLDDGLDLARFSS